MVSVKYAITPDDYTNYFMYLMWDAPERKKSRFKYYLRQIAFNAGIIALLIYTQIFRYSTNTFYIYGGIILFMMVVQLLSGRINTKKQAEKIIANQENQSFFLEAFYDISDAGILRKDENEETKYHWKAFIRKEETAEYYFLFTSSMQAVIFPKRVFKTTEDKKQFEKLLSEHLSFDAEVGHLIKK